MKNRKSKIAFMVFLISLVCGIAFAIRFPQLFSFNNKKSLDKWREKVFTGRVLYTVNLVDSGGYLSAQSEKSASGIFYRLSFHAVKKPMVSWKWKVVKFPAKKSTGDTQEGWIEKDDYAARVYIIFPSFLFSRTKSLEYVWDKDLPEGLILTSPFFENIKIIVAESGENNLGNWVFEERNIREDFKKAFGREPGVVGAVAIMTDSDNTISTAEAWYDELRVGYANEE